MFRVGGDPQPLWSRGHPLHPPAPLGVLISLTFDLTSNLCDAYTDLRGELTETGFVGVQKTGGMLGGTEIGSVYGVRIPNLR